jgi:hypothetical protein
MDSSAPPPGSVVGYVRALTGQLVTVSGDVLEAAYLHGSAVLGGWAPGRSDVDMLLVAADGIGSGVVERMGQVLCEAAGRCPGRELECSVVTVAQAGQLAWGIGHASEVYAVLNACRALIYLTDGTIVSKIAGGEAVLRRGAGPAEVIRRALGQQGGTEPGQPPAADAAGFVLATAAALRSAAGEPAG